MAQQEQNEPGEKISKIKLVIAYDGAAYQGWQWQKVGTGVQEKIEEALGKTLGSTPRVIGSSRTDTGVHALGMIAHFKLPPAHLNFNPRKILLALNAHLPDDIRILKATRAKPRFHAQFDATGKEYRYYLWNHPAHNPLLLGRCWHMTRPLDLAAMREAAKHFPGTKNFESFAVNRSYRMASYVRTLNSCRIQKSGPLLTFVIRGEGFLYRMCRGIVGTLVQVGIGKYKPEQVAAMLEARNREMAGMSAPAHGLVLQKVFYGKKKPWVRPEASDDVPDDE